MSRRSQSPRSDKIPIKYGRNPVKGEPYELFSPHKHSPILPENSKKDVDKSEPTSSKILSTDELISAVGQIWDYASSTLTVSQSKDLRKNDYSCQKDDIVHILGEVDKSEAHISTESKHFSAGVRSTRLVFEPWGKNCINSLLWRFLPDQINNSPDLKEKRLTNVDTPYELKHIYGWMNEIIPGGRKFPVNFTRIENIGHIQTEEVSPSKHNVSREIINIENDLNIRSDELFPNTLECNDSSSIDAAKDVSSTRAKSLCSDLLEDVQDTEAHESSVLRTLSYNSSAPSDIGTQESQDKATVDELLEIKSMQFEKSENKIRSEIYLPACDKPHHSLAKQEHAFAGALSGVCVSLCLHPVDTIKTVVQSCRADQKSICYIGRSIVSERGLTGLYRGISSNVASSAPISAVYTFTYESVKGALLPMFSKESQSFAHCIAGGCASIATSFIFTPSERIKQQMQVGSHYQNCWKALVGIIGNGGLPSLYAGWGAVLCRNVPHSIIKFYAYENLKQFMMSSLQSNANAQPSTSQTLVCGGLAGSTAALFSTPFDVVKTRLQTQIPGSVSQYSSVFHAIQHIRKQEGFKGLYRGLTPRLVMYMSQGALFFASYEFFKHLFALEAPHQHNS